MKRILPAVLLAALFALPAPAANTGHAVYRPGLTQARIPFPSAMGYLTAYDGVPMLASNLLANADAAWLDRTLDVFKDGEHSNSATNPVSGKAWPWLIEHNHGVFAYEGELFVEEGVEYSFYGRADTGEALVVDGETVVWQGKNRGWQYGPEIHRRWTAPKTGWVPFNGWLWSWNGSYGTQWSTWSLQYNLQGVVVTFLDPSDRLSDRSESLNSWLEENRGLTNVWQRFADPGNGTFLRSVTCERFTTVGESAAAEGGRTFDLAFAGVPTNAQLVAFSGPADGFHDAGNWAAPSAVLAEVPPGASTTNVVVPLAADARVLRFRLAHFDAASTNGLEVFEEWTEMFPVTAEPVVRIASVAPGYTNVVVAGSVGSFGIGGSNAVVTVEVAAADDSTFGHPVSSNVLAAAAALGDFHAEVSGLATNAAYLVRATARNDRGATGFSAPVAFSTRSPGPPAASVEATVCAYLSATLEATVSDWGGGSSGAEAWIDVSENPAFPAGATQTLPLGALSGAVPATASATAEGLRPDTDHFVRVRTVNSWGLASVSETTAFRTASEPIGFPRPTAVAYRGGVAASLAPRFVTDGTVYDVAIYAEAPGFWSGTYDTWSNQTGFGPFEWQSGAPPGVEVLIRYTIDWSFPDTGAFGQIVVSNTATAKLADRTIESLPEIDPDYKHGEVHGAYLRPGDTVEIIPSTGARIDWHTNAVLSITPTNGVFLLEALEPGATLLYESGADGKPNGVTGVAIVLPAEDPAGGVYVHRGFADWTWTDPSQWETVVEGPRGYPNAVGAVAYVIEPQITDAKSHDIEVTEPVTVGSLFIGQLGWIHHVANTKTEFFTQLVDPFASGGSLRFDTGDGSTSTLGMLGHCYVASPVKIQIPVSAANDLDVDELDRIPDSDGWRDWRDHGLKFNRPVDFGPHVFRTRRGHYYPGRINAYERGFLTFTDDVCGSGLIRFEADSIAGMQDGSDAARLKSFTGVWDIANGQYGKSGLAMGGAGLNFVRASLGNASELIVRGNWHMADASWNAGAFVRSGYDEGAWTNDWNDALPPKVTLDGGWLRLETPGGAMNAAATAAYNATGIRRAYFRTRDFVVPAGPQGRFETMIHGNSVSYPNTVVEITNLFVDAGTVLSFTLDTVSGAVANEVTIVNEPADVWTDADTGLQFLPQLYANHEANDNNQLIFRHPTTGLLSRRTAGTGDNDAFRRWTAAATLANGAQYASMQLGANTTLSFADGATVTNLAGYLDLRGGAAVGPPSEAASATAALAFGAAPARVYVGKRTDTAAIGCRLSGTAGLVKGGSGTLELGATLAGLSGGVRIAGGTLAVGAPAGNGALRPGFLSGNVFVEAGSRLAIRNKKALANDTRLFLRDREWIPSRGHVRLDASVFALELRFGDRKAEPGSWGSSASGAEHVDDVHFEGEGVLFVGPQASLMILR